MTHRHPLTALIGLASLLTGCAPAAPTSSRRGAPIAEGAWYTVRASGDAVRVELPGSVEPERRLTLRAPLAGRLRRLADHGTRVSAGDPLAVLDPEGLAAQASAASAARDAAESRRAGAQTAARQAVLDADAKVLDLESTLLAAKATRDRQRSLLAEAVVRGASGPAGLRAQLEAAEARVRLLKTGEQQERIRQAAAELEATRAELKVAVKQVQQQQQLFARGYVPTLDVEIARLNWERARATETKLIEQLNLLRKGAHPEAIREAEALADAARQAVQGADGLQEQVAQRRADLAAAQAEVHRLRRSLETARTHRLAVTRAEQEAAAAVADARRASTDVAEAERRLKQAVIRAPFAGQVIRLLARPEERVAEGGLLLELVDPARLQFLGSASAADLTHLRTGVRVRVNIRAEPPLSVPGRIVEVVHSTDAARQDFGVRIALAPDGRLRPGMLGTARLSLASEAGRIRVPLNALRRHFPREERAEVMLLEGERPVARSVRLAPGRLEDPPGTVLVQTGLRVGDRVLLPEGGDPVRNETTRVRSGHSRSQPPS